MTHEVERCARAVEVARGGKTVAVVSSGDAGIYGMAGLVFELMAASGSDDVKVEVIPGVPAFVEAAAKADFVILLYNPKSSKRVEGLGKALSIIGRYRKGATPVGIVRNASREDEEALITTLDNVPSLADRIDMLTILVIGNSSTFIAMGRMVTPRGYRLEGAKG